MRTLAPVLLPAATTALAVATVSTVVLPTTAAQDPPPAPDAVAARTVPAGSPSGPRAPLPALRPPATAPGSRTVRVPSAPSQGRWSWPLEPRPDVARPFVRPASAWGAGHRGVDLRSPVGGSVLAVDAGVVSHVGVVAGRGTVTLLHRSGLRSTYEPVSASVAVGDEVGRGAPIGTLEAGGHCAPAACLHLGALRGEVYLDPLTLLGTARVRLLPLP